MDFSDVVEAIKSVAEAVISLLDELVKEFGTLVKKLTSGTVYEFRHSEQEPQVTHEGAGIVTHVTKSVASVEPPTFNKRVQRCQR